MRFLIVGCGRVGARLLQSLTGHGHHVTVVDNDPVALERLTAASVASVLGMGFDRDVLLQAGIERVDGLAATTGVDEVNVLVARLARQIYHVPRVVARVYDPRKADIYRRLGIFTVSPVVWGADRLAEALVSAELAPLLSIASGDVNLLMLEARPLLVGRTVQSMTVPRELHVTAIHRRGHAFLPGAETVIQAGDTLYVAVVAGAGQYLEALTRDA